MKVFPAILMAATIALVVGKHKPPQKYELMPAQTEWWKNYPCGMVTNFSGCKDGKKTK